MKFIPEGPLMWLERRSRWSELRELGQSNLVKSSVLMPVFGYLLLLNEHVHSFLVIPYDAGWPFRDLHQLWRLWLLFYGTFSLAAGSVLFSYWCPKEIKQYATPFELIETERPFFTSHTGFTQRVADRLDQLYRRMSECEKSIFDLPLLKPDQPHLAANTGSGDPWGMGFFHIGA